MPVARVTVLGAHGLTLLPALGNCSLIDPEYLGFLLELADQAPARVMLALPLWPFDKVLSGGNQLQSVPDSQLLGRCMRLPIGQQDGRATGVVNFRP